MKNSMETNRSVGGPTPVFLKTVVDHLLDAILPEAVNRNSFLINHISRETPVQGHEKMLNLVLGNVLCELSQQTHFGVIHIHSDASGSTIQIKVSNRSFSPNPSFNLFIETIQVIAHHLGGQVAIQTEIAKDLLIKMQFRISSKKAA